jgi:hypothetical protein
VVESKPDSAVADLRFHAPWPQLQALAESVDLAKLDDIEHKHVPYGVWYGNECWSIACMLSLQAPGMAQRLLMVLQ